MIIEGDMLTVFVHGTTDGVDHIVVKSYNFIGFIPEIINRHII